MELWLRLGSISCPISEQEHRRSIAGENLPRAYFSQSVYTKAVTITLSNPTGKRNFHPKAITLS